MLTKMLTKAEVIKVIRGESNLSSDLLNKLYEEAKAKAVQSEQAVLRLDEKFKSSEAMKTALAKQFDDLQTWSDMYDKCDTDTKKMIISHVIKSVRVSRDYNVEIDMSVACEELGMCLEGRDAAESMEKSA